MSQNEPRKKLIIINNRYPFKEFDENFIKPFVVARLNPMNKKGLINTIRKELNMPAMYIASRLKASINPKELYVAGNKIEPKTAQAVYEFERSEEAGTISINSLRKVADALDMQLVYSFIPKKQDSLTDWVYSKVKEKTDLLSNSKDFDDESPEMRNKLQEQRMSRIANNLDNSFWKELI